MLINEVITPKGTRTLFVHAPGNTAATIQVWFRAGSVLEEEHNQGIAHFLEHMFFKGTKKRPGNKLADEVETFGGEINAFTSFDYTCYYINCPKSKIGKSVEILMDMISSPQFKVEDIVPEREVVLEEYKRSQDSSSQYSFLKVQQVCFQGDYQRPVIGNQKTIKSFSRKQLIDFRKKYYHQSNMLVVIAGDVEEQKDIVKIIDRFKLDNGKISQYPKFELKKKAGAHVHQKDAQMCQLTIAIQGPDYRSAEGPIEDLAINCLGHGETSRLYHGLVTTQTLANTASASTLYLANGSAHMIRINFPPEHSKKVYAKLHALLMEIQKDGLKPDELSKIQGQYVASKVYERESIESLAFTYGNSYIQTEDYHCEQSFIEKLNNAKTDETSDALRRILSRPIHLSLQIPKHQSIPKHKGELTQLLKNLEKFQLKKSTQKKATNYGKMTHSQFDEQVKIVEIIPGVTLLHRYNPLTPTFATQIYTKGGLTEETEKNNGIHTLLTALLNRGHASASYQVLQQYLEDHSASLYGFAGKNAYGMMLHGQTKDLDPLLQHLFSSFLTPSFAASELKHEMELTLRALKAQEEDPVKHCFENFNQLVFHQHPYALNMLGSPATISKITAKKIKELHQSNLANKEILISFCGDCSFDHIYDTVKSLVKDLKPRKRVPLKPKKTHAIYGQRINIPFAREQAHIMMGFAVPRLGHKHSVYLKMLTAHLAGQSSDLFVEVRDRQGLCYSAQPVNFSALEAGYWGIYIACAPEKVEPAIAAIKKIVNDVAKKGISPRDFAKIKSMIKGQNEMNIQTNEDYATTYSVPQLQGLGVDHFYIGAKEIEALSYEDFQREIQIILKADANIVVVGG